MKNIKVKVSSPSNIALVKYWGKKNEQEPINPSISITLNNSITIMEMERSESPSLSLDFYFEGQKNNKFEEKILKKLKRFSLELPWINNSRFIINSKNTFPHSTGIASSASSMSALAFCLYEVDKELFGNIIDKHKVSNLARVGSGSASRSIFPFLSSWGKSHIEGSSDLHAVGIPLSKVHKCFHKIYDAILIVSSEEKKVSSTVGHELMENHPHRESRIKFASSNLDEILVSLQNGDFDSFAKVCEHEALDLHSMMMTSTPSFILLEPNSLQLIKEIRNFRERTNEKITFTIDAGPNIHVLYLEESKQKVEEFLGELKSKNVFDNIIFDEMGEGPKSLS